MKDFEHHLDTARLWWNLDDEVLAAIIEGPSTTEPFKRIALYTQSLKAAATEGNGAASTTAAITKVAIRLAADPVTPALREEPPAVLCRIARGFAVSVLGLVSLLGLLIAGDAAQVIDIPQTIEAFLDHIGT